MSEPASPQSVDAQNPWIGLASFSENEREFFAGRGEEIEQLLRLVRRDSLTLLYGISGLGKTSLLQAGLFPALRKEDFLPVAIRLDFLESAAPLATQVLEAISAAAVAAKVDAPRPRAVESLWEYFHRQENHFWSPQNDLVTLFLAFDQFEEYFTLGRETAERARRASAFIDELADLVENRPPGALRDDPARAREFSFKSAPINVLLSMREDYLGDLDYIRSRFRALTQNRMRLRPMGEAQAREVIALGESLIAPGVADRIVKYVAGAGENGEAVELTVAPALLSLVLRQLNEKRRKPDGQITLDLLNVEQEKILEDFYVSTLAKFPPGVRTFVEDELLTATGHRNSCALDDALEASEVTKPILDQLVDRRLLAYEDRHRTKRVELTHDVLLPVIKASRDARLTSEARAEAERLREKQAAQRLRQHLTTAAAVALFLTLVATLWGGYYAFLQEHRTYYRQWSKRNGFPEGIEPISESQARKLPVSYELAHKGVFRDGWKLHWKPAFRMTARNGSLEPTTRHNVSTYLWRGESEADTVQGTRPDEKGQRLGLQTLCQWEFISTAKGEILYERGLDSAGRMLYGLIYSPRGAGPADTRLARFVGPDGFPQFQRQSGAEYVEIHYDKEGWEDRVLYRDGKNLPAAGPFGAFGQMMSHNSRGQMTRVLSLDANETTMVDAAGNCGMDTIYDAKGWAIEERSLGPDLQPMPVKQGWVNSKFEYDPVGRFVSSTYYDAAGRPLLTRDGYHGWQSDYDDRGNQIAGTYVGLDRKPTLVADGYAGWKCTYDAPGRITRMTFHGVAGEPVRHKDGNHGWEAQFDAHGNQVSMTYLSLDGKPTPIVLGFASSKSTFDALGRATNTSYFGANNEPVLHKQGYHKWSGVYDDRGNVIEATYFGLENEPIILADGYATYRKQFDSDGNELEASYFDDKGKPTLYANEGFHKLRCVYDARGKVTRQSYYGVNGELVLHRDGHHAWEAQYDWQGNRTAVTYFGLEGRFTALEGGYAMFRSEYDARGKVIRETCHGPNGEPALNKDGYHGWSADYDTRGNQVEKAYFDLKGEPAWRSEGYSKVLSVVDERGNVVRQTFHGVTGEPVLHKEGYHGWEVKYDQKGNQLEVTYFGLDGKPVLLAEGYATRKSVYDLLNHCLEETYYGINGEPVSQKDGYHGWRSECDVYGHQLATTYFGVRREPVLRGENFASVRSAYNSHGKQTRSEYYGVTREAILHREGFHAFEEEFDDRDNLTAVTYLGLDGKPTLLTDNYATVRYVYNSRNKPTRTTYYGVKGEPVMYKGEYNGLQTKYDDHNNAIEIGYLDVAGKPFAQSNGIALVRSRFDVFGNNIEISAHGLNGEPVNLGANVQRMETVRDGFGRIVREAWHDKEGRPGKGSAGVNAMKYIYDGRGLLVAKVGLDGNEQPMVDAQGIHEQVFEYDDKRRQTKAQFFGLNHTPAENEEGNHLVLHLFNERGFEVRESRLRANGGPNWDRELGVATHVTGYDGQGRWNEYAYYNEHDRLVIGPEGYAKLSLLLGESGDEERVYRGADDKPVFDPLVGYATQKSIRSRPGETVDSYHDANGALIAGPEGYAEMRRRWSDGGEIVQESFFGRAGEPVPGPAGAHRIERVPGAAADALSYFDVDGRPFHSLGTDELASLVFVTSIENLHRPAAKAKLQAGDILWRYGNWSLSESLQEARATSQKMAEVAARMRETFLAERARLSDSQVPMTVIRQNQVLLLFMPPLPEKVAGMTIQSRDLPLAWFEKLRALAETPPPPATKATPTPVPKVPVRKKTAENSVSMDGLGPSIPELDRNSPLLVGRSG